MSIHFLGMDLDLDEVTKESFSSNVPSVVRLWLGSTVKSETWPMSCQEKWQVEGNQDVAWWVKLEDKDWNDPFPELWRPCTHVLNSCKTAPSQEASRIFTDMQALSMVSSMIQTRPSRTCSFSSGFLHGSRPQVAKKNTSTLPSAPAVPSLALLAHAVAPCLYLPAKRIQRSYRKVEEHVISKPKNRNQ